jgi:hypothetical protein
MGERDVRGEVGELCGSGRSRAVRGNYDNIWAFLAVGFVVRRKKLQQEVEISSMKRSLTKFILTANRTRINE